MGAEIIVDVEGDSIELEQIDIGVADDTLAFEISGVIRDVDDETLEQVANKQVVPTEIKLRIVEENEN